MNTREGSDSKQRESGRALYNMVIDRRATVSDFKAKLGRELGFEAGQVLVYSKNVRVEDMVFLTEMQGFDAEEDILLCITLGASTKPAQDLAREPTGGIRVADVLAMVSQG